MRYVNEAEPYESLRQVLHPELAKLPPGQLEAVLSLHGIDAEGLNDILGAISQVGAQIGQRLPAIGQGALQGASMGGVAGPYGALLGALGGAVAGGLSAPGRPAAPQPQPGVPAAAPAPLAPGAAAGPAPAAPAAGAQLPPLGGGSPAAAQLLSMIMQPQVLQALSAMLLGGAGTRTVSVAGTPLPVAAIPNALSVLANQAASEYNEVFNAAGEGESAYLYGANGELAFDPSDSADRADAVVQLFQREGVQEAAPRAPRQVRRRPAPARAWVEAAAYDEVYP